jgi:outer membrane receptor for ferrienterochelin and colicin
MPTSHSLVRAGVTLQSGNLSPMQIPRWTLRIAAVVLAALAVGTTRLSAQGVTTGAISGTVTDSSGRALQNAQIEIQNLATGYRAGGLTRDNGRYLVQGLEVGTYRVTARLIGYAPQARNDVRVTLNLATPVDFVMAAVATQIAGVTVTAQTATAEFSPTRQGVGTVVNDSLIARLPTLQRDFTDLVKLTPQVITNTGGGPSAAGGYNRLNNFTVDGANQNDRFNLGSSGGVPGGATGGRIMSVDAVKEFQVLLSPTDVRYGNFAGMLVNAVTRSGTNEFRGGATYTFREPDMARDIDQIRESGFKVRQYGFHVGGPIIKDKLHFFIAPEWQDRTDPTTGTTVDATTIGNTNTRVSLDSIAIIQQELASRGLQAGGTENFSRGNPLTNLMGRLDWSINQGNRFTFRVLDNTAEQDEFSRNTGSLASQGVIQQSSGIRLTSNSFTRQAKNRSFTSQLFTNFGSGTSNELLVGYNTIRDLRIVPVNAPEVSIGVTPVGGTSPSVAVTAGTERFSPGNDLKQRIFELADNVSIPFGAHTFTVGGRYERTYIYNYFLSGAGNGAFTFPTIAALQAGQPSGYAFSYANGGDIAAEFRGQQISAYAQDLWNVSDNVAVTVGLRVDVPTFLDTPKNNPFISDSTNNEIRTDWKPKTQALWSPRIGVNWDVNGTETTQIRANAGIFTGQVPYILVGNAYANTGLGGVTVACTQAGTVPAFTTDVSQLPHNCEGQSAPAPGQAGTVGVNVTDPNFKYPQNFTTSFGIDRKLPGGFIGTFEALYRKDINALYIRDLNLTGPRMVNGAPYRDVEGRILYADTISATGSITNTGQKRLLRTGNTGSQVNFSEGAIMLTNAKAGYQYALTGQIRKRFNRAFEATAAYTYNQAHDVQSLTSDRAISNWRFGRQFSGLENDPNDAQVSNFQRPHRVVAYGTWTLPWKNQTDVSLYFEGISGSSITYVTSADINGDGIGGNDPIYIPRDATDPNEIRIGTGSNATFQLNQAAGEAFNRFIDLQPCLKEQRGHIMKRNSCQGPFQKRMDVSVRQTLPEVQGQRLTLQLDVFNFLNLVNKNWGQNKFPVGGTFNNLTFLRTAGHQPGPLNTAQWNYNIDSGYLNAIQQRNSVSSLNPNTAANNYQIQLTARYSF